MNNQQRNKLIIGINDVINGRITHNIRAISAMYEDDGISIQYVHNEEVKDEDEILANDVASAIENAFGGQKISTEFMQVRTPVIYVEQMLPIVILAMFEQNPNNFLD